MTSNAKDTIYIDVDDEITSIIDKVHSAHHQIVALVLPKRASMLQSTVNMKLLKRAATNSKKHLVLITSEAGLLALAGAVGLHVAKNLQSRPEIPTAAAAQAIDDLANADEPVVAEDFDSHAAAAVAVGALAGDDESAAADAKPAAKPELTPRPIPRATAAEETVALDNTESDAKPAEKAAKGAKKKGKDKKLKVPNFEKFRLRLILGIVAVIVLIVIFILANIVLPKATIIVSTNTSTVNSSLTLNLDTSASQLDPNQMIVPANAQQSQKTASKNVPTTGQQNQGQAATGQVTMTNCSASGNSITIPAGTGLSANGLTYLTQSSATLPTSTFDSHGNCRSTSISSQSVNISAQSPGTQYNVNSTSFTVSGNSEVTATGSTSGGTTNNVQVVAQTDIDSAKSQISLPSNASMKASLASALTAAGWYPIQTSFSSGTPSVSQSANVGDQASTVTVTETVTYTMFGVHQSDLNSLITANVDGQIDTSKQAIQNTGLNSANFTVVSQTATKAQIGMQTTAIVGPKLNIGSLKQQIEGKKKGDVQSIINQDPGVTSVTVNYSPFWVSSTPKNISKITIKFQKAS